MKRQKIHRIGAMVLIMVLCWSHVPVVAVHATSTKEQLEQAERQQAEVQGRLEDTQNNIEDMEFEKSELQVKLSQLNDDLTEVSDRLEKLEKQIEDTEEEMEITAADLVEAKETEQTQYANMKKRIQFMYEKKNNMYLEILFSSNGFSEFLNRSSYIQEVSEYDQKMLAEYEQCRILIEKKEEELNHQKAALDELLEQTKAEQEKVSGYVNATSSSISKYSGQIEDAYAAAEAYEAEIKKNEENIAYLKQKLAEEIAKSKLAAQSSWRDISDIEFAEGDRYLLANLIYCEAGGEPYEGQVAVGAVVMNRVMSEVFPGTVVGVIYQNRQFSPVASGRLAVALAENRATPSCYQAADAAMQGQTNVGKCLFFRTPIDGLTGIPIGGHIFY